MRRDILGAAVSGCGVVDFINHSLSYYGLCVGVKRFTRGVLVKRCQLQGYLSLMVLL
jgi:hypothetical protein